MKFSGTTINDLLHTLIQLVDEKKRQWNFARLKPLLVYLYFDNILTASILGTTIRLNRNEWFLLAENISFFFFLVVWSMNREQYNSGILKYNSYNQIIRKSKWVFITIFTIAWSQKNLSPEFRISLSWQQQWHYFSVIAVAYCTLTWAYNRTFLAWNRT